MVFYYDDEITVEYFNMRKTLISPKLLEEKISFKG